MVMQIGISQDTTSNVCFLYLGGTALAEHGGCKPHAAYFRDQKDGEALTDGR